MIASVKTSVFFLFVAFGFPALTLQQKPNNPPQIRLSLSAKEKFLKWNSLVPYSITVSDAEDGRSEYNEIPSNEVLLEVRFVSDTSLAKKVASGEESAILDVPLRMGKALCFNCHGVKTKIIGPSFEQIAKRYKGIPHVEDSLAARVVLGSTGIWSDVKMPPHPDLEKKDVLKIVRWILKNGDDPDLNYFAGLQGSFRTKEKPTDSSSRAGYILTASYADHGAEAREGRDRIVLGVQ